MSVKFEHLYRYLIGSGGIFHEILVKNSTGTKTQYTVTAPTNCRKPKGGILFSIIRFNEKDHRCLVECLTVANLQPAPPREIAKLILALFSAMRIENSERTIEQEIRAAGIPCLNDFMRHLTALLTANMGQQDLDRLACSVEDMLNACIILVDITR